MCFGSYGTCTPMAVAPTQAASSQAAGIGCLFSAARTWQVTCLPVVSTLSAKMQHIPRLKYKISYTTVLHNVKDVSWCTIFRSDKILLTLYMIKLALISIFEIWLLKHILWENITLPSHQLNDKSLNLQNKKAYNLWLSNYNFYNLSPRNKQSRFVQMSVEC